MQYSNFSFGPGYYPYKDFYIKAIAVLKEEKEGRWSPQFLLINMEQEFFTEEEATAAAKDELSEAYLKVAATGNDRAMAEYLSSIGYCKLEEDARN